MSAFRILGIDPGSQFMGLGCVETKGSAIQCIGQRTIVIPAHADAWEKRLKDIFLAVQAAIAEWQPQAIAVEEVFFAKNAQSALKLGQARGAALTAAALSHLPVAEYSATLVKQTLTGSGRSDKSQVEAMVKVILGASLAKAGALARHDAADALAIAICHAQQSRAAARIHLGHSPRLG